MTDKFQVLSDRTEVLEAKLKIWDKNVTASLDDLAKSKVTLTEELRKYALSTTSDIKLNLERITKDGVNELNNTAKNKLSELSKVGTKELISKLQNGSVALKLSGLSIMNNNKTNVIAMYPDRGGDGYIRVNAQNGDMRYLLTLSNNKPQGNFYNNNGKLGLSIGIYSDSNISFMRLRDENGDKTLFEINSNNRDGKLSSYSNKGKQIVYLGPEKNSGNGLVNVLGINGEETASHSPK